MDLTRTSAPGTSAGARDRIDHLERLLKAGGALSTELDLPTVLYQILEAASELTGARNGTLGVLDEPRRELAQLLTVGFDDAPGMAINDQPYADGILDLLIKRGEPVRRQEVAPQKRGNGRPDGLAPSVSLVGAPITIRGQTWGGLYLTDKRDAEQFDEHDLESIVVLAERAAVAIDNAHLFDEATTRRHELERALRAMRTAMEIATAVGSDTDLSRILELIVSRGRALVEADALLIWLRQGDELRIAAVAGNADVPRDAAIPLKTSTAGEALRAARSVRVEDVQQMRVKPSQYGMSQASSTLIVPLVHRGRGHGVLMAFDHLGATASFDADDQRTLEAFAASAATAVATARSVEAQRLQDTLTAAESERRRWARELHDETLQGLASLKLALADALKAEPHRQQAVLQSAVAQLEHAIAGLRTIIADLRPAALDELGLEPALRTLVRRMAETSGLQAQVAIDLGGVRLGPDIETIAYRVVQEALTNVAKHANAREIAIEVRLDAGGLRLAIADDGRGLGREPGEGYGIVGMRERAALASGSLEIERRPGGGTCVRLELPPG